MDKTLSSVKAIQKKIRDRDLDLSSTENVIIEYLSNGMDNNRGKNALGHRILV